jgi:hypothetical protein
MTYLRTDNIGSSFDPRLVCGMDHIRPAGARNCNFPLPECCLADCENEIAAGDCPDHSGPKAACSRPHFLLHTGSAAPPSASDGRRSEPPQSPMLSSLPWLQ